VSGYVRPIIIEHDIYITPLMTYCENLGAFGEGVTFQSESASRKRFHGRREAALTRGAAAGDICSGNRVSDFRPHHARLRPRQGRRNDRGLWKKRGAAENPTPSSMSGRDFGALTDLSRGGDIGLLIIRCFAFSVL
jgi:hypothetical protein